MRHQDAVLRQLHLRLPNQEPLARGPALLAILVVHVVAALHANDRLLVLTHGQLLQVKVGLEQHVAHARAGNPAGLEALHEHGSLGVEELAVSIHRVEREEGLPVVPAPDLEREREVLDVHGRGRLDGGGDADSARVLVHDQAAHALHHGARQLCCRDEVPRDALGPPPDVKLGTAGLPQGDGVLLPGLRLLLELPELELSEALAVQEVLLLGPNGISHVPDGQTTVGT
mmetsp:Transcript_91257/g.258449  ORF Transcript_91257/g.258449 Transcript_91257/m.258449 type:complete len:229 (-) Transcript_91257:81-767(-)